jgi:uncharacterized membrane protein YfcA
VTVLGYLGALVAFLAIYAVLRRRAVRRGTARPLREDARWIALIVAFAAVAALIGVLTRN